MKTNQQMMAADKSENAPIPSSGQAQNNLEKDHFGSTTLATILLIALLLVLAAFRPLALPDEGRYAEIGRWMAQSGDWLAPRLNGLPFFHKPPLLYWLEGAVSQLMSPFAWSLRLIPAFHAALILALMGPVLKKLLGPTVAIRSVVIFGSSAAFLLGGQYINHDMMVASWISVAITAFGYFVIQVARLLESGLQIQAERFKSLRQTAWIGFAACGLGVLSKGLIGVVLPGLVLLIWLCWSGKWQTLKVVPWISGTTVFLVIALPWFVLAEHAYPGMLDYMFGVHQFERFTGKQFNNAQPFWFYGAAISLLLGPWMIWFWAYQVRKILDFFTKNVSSGVLGALRLVGLQFNPSKQRLRSDDQLFVGLLLIWVWVIVVFFSIPNSKIIGYVLPVTPPMAVLCALGWERLIGAVRYEKFIWRSFLLVSVVLLVGINYQAARLTRRHFSEDVAVALKCQDLKNAQIMVLGEYPYDLPFLISFDRPLWVIQDWDFERMHAGDNWRRELFEGANFEPSKGDSLKSLDTLSAQAGVSNRWLLAPKNSDRLVQVRNLGYQLVKEGSAWNLYRTLSTRDELVNNSGNCRP